jgi:hypothetical protein
MEKLILILALLGVLFLLRSYIKLMFFLGLTSFVTLVFLCSSPCTEALVWIAHQKEATAQKIEVTKPQALLSFDNGKTNLELMERIYEEFPHRFKRSRISRPLSGSLPF